MFSFSDAFAFVSVGEHYSVMVMVYKISCILLSYTYIICHCCEAIEKEKENNRFSQWFIAFVNIFRKKKKMKNVNIHTNGEKCSAFSLHHFSFKFASGLDDATMRFYCMRCVCVCVICMYCCLLHTRTSCVGFVHLFRFTRYLSWTIWPTVQQSSIFYQQ